jgi:uncharacterized protein
MIAIDTNILVYAHRSGVPQHRAARRALLRAANDDAGWGIALPSLAEFWSVATHPASTGQPSSPAEAAAFLRSLTVSAAGRVWAPGVGFADRLLALTAERGIRGPRIFDLQIALLAVENGAREIWTHDKDFLALPGLSVRDPLT